jgi:hypothetical protein
MSDRKTVLSLHRVRTVVDAFSLVHLHLSHCQDLEEGVTNKHIS